MATLDELKHLLEQIKEQIDKGPLVGDPVAHTQVVTVTGLSDLDDNLGLVKAGEFRAGKGVPGRGFTGVRIGYPAFSYNDTDWHIVGINSDTLQFGLRATDGVAVTAGGLITLSARGIEVANNALHAGLRFLTTTDSVGGYVSADNVNNIKITALNRKSIILNVQAGTGGDTKPPYVDIRAGNDLFTGAGLRVTSGALGSSTNQGGVYRRTEAKLMYSSAAGARGGLLSMVNATQWGTGVGDSTAQVAIYAGTPDSDAVATFFNKHWYGDIDFEIWGQDSGTPMFRIDAGDSKMYYKGNEIAVV